MFMTEDIVDVPLGQHPVARKYMREMFELMSKEPGFRNAQIAAYCGHIRQHMLLTYWNDAAGYEAWTKSAAAQDLASRRRPYRQRPDGTRWELLLETPGPEKGNFLNQGILKVVDEKLW